MWHLSACVCGGGSQGSSHNGHGSSWTRRSPISGESPASSAHLCEPQSLPSPSARKQIFRGRHGGGGKRRGVENLTNDTPPKKGVLDPPSYGTFSTPPQVSVLCFSCTKIHGQSRPEAPLEGSKNFSGERVLWYVSPPPPLRFAPPHITAQDLWH